MKKEVILKLETLVTAAFGLVAALAWNAAIQSLFVDGGTLHFLAAGGPWIYAVLVTILAVILTIWLGRLTNKSKNN